MRQRFEYQARWEQYDGGWWPEKMCGFTTHQQANDWLDGIKAPVRNGTVWRRAIGEWE